MTSGVLSLFSKRGDIIRGGDTSYRDDRLLRHVFKWYGSKNKDKENLPSSSATIKEVDNIRGEEDMQTDVVRGEEDRWMPLIAASK